MKKITLLLFIYLTAFLSFSQIPIGTWRDHFSLQRGVLVSAGNEKIFVASPNGVFWYRPADGVIGKITCVNGLSDVGISTITFLETQKLLLVGYENGNIDLVYESRVINIPYIMDKPMAGSKRINHFTLGMNSKVYVSTGFGIVVLNLSKNEVLDTYYIGPNGAELWVSQTAISEDVIFAATESGLYSAQVNDPLLIHFASWAIDTSIPNHENSISSMVLFEGKLVVNQNQSTSLPDKAFYLELGIWHQISTSFTQVKNLWSDQSRLLMCSRQGIAIYQSLSGEPSVYTSYAGYGGFSPNYAVFDSQGNIAVADNWFGLMYLSQNGWNPIKPNGPSDNTSYYVLPTADDVLVAGGSRNTTWGNIFYPLIIHTFSQQEWNTIYNNSFFDAVRIVKSPFSENEYYVALWGKGIVVYKDGVQTDWYNPNNSSLETSIPGDFCRIGGLVFDKNRNLWASNAAVANPISVRLPDGTWKSFPYQSQIGSQRISDIVLSPQGHLWVIVPSGGGLFILDPGDNPTQTSSHTYRKLFLSENNGTLLSNDIHSLAFDRDGYLWVGTTEGVVVSYNPERVFQPSSFSAQRVKVPDIVQGLAVFLLETETVTCIAVDGANRKWFGTSRSGVFLQSADGTRQIKHFNKENSPIPSNTIQHIAIHPKTGEVFIATDNGLVSYRGDAIEPFDTFGKVYAFPNPVRHDYYGVITFTGLVDNTIVKVTDVSGNLVFETRSLGGQATWDGNNFQGNRVATGVYLFFCADSKGEQTAVGKILFVK
jgi:ligand-binding sensor domain-containing protein